MLGDEQQEVRSMTEGNIAVAVGLKNVSQSHRQLCTHCEPSIIHWQTFTGDTLVQSAAVAKAALVNGGGVATVLAGVDAPPPVFFCTVEPASVAQQAGRCMFTL